jgi:hypothetical protein
MKALYEAYKDKAAILVVYIREAHPAKAEQTAEDAGWKAIEGTVFYQPKTYEERRKLAETACTFWELPIPTLIDTMDPGIGKSYAAWPNRLYLLDTEGKIAYRGVKGPPGVNVHEGELELRKMLGITEGEPVTKPRASRSAPSGRGRFSRKPPASGGPAAGETKPSKPWWEDDSSDEPEEKAEEEPAEKKGSEK